MSAKATGSVQMTDNFEAARRNMVKCQLNTNGVTAPRVLEVFGTIPREKFLPQDRRFAAYTDNCVTSAAGSLIEPLIHARMVQALHARQEDAALVIGDGCGYAAAILSPLVSTVVSLEEKPDQMDVARTAWTDLGLCNIATVRGSAPEGSPAHAPYNIIFINGGVCDIPETLIGQLAPGGRLVCVLKENKSPCGQVVMAQKFENGIVGRMRLYDAFTNYLPGFEPKPKFVF